MTSFLALKWIITGVFSLIFSWYGMEAIHELGHVLHAVFSGAQVQSVSIPLWGISCTHVNPNPHPAFVAWGGPVWGVTLPVIGWFSFSKLTEQSRVSRFLLFFAGFCCIANGAYLGVGWIDSVGDAGDLLRHGVHFSWLICFGVVNFVAGLWLWHWLTLQLRSPQNRWSPSNLEAENNGDALGK